MRLAIMSPGPGTLPVSMPTTRLVFSIGWSKS
eukprot:Nitzschia sp. Nitz4//scaffold4_size323378//98386//98481//NITZ4_000643-RA/size323378-exonerate_protein2genome-gene-0.209-mRNA-1//1//CDS//3329553348//7014//frame0